jgi:hypothetical protein
MNSGTLVFGNETVVVSFIQADSQSIFALENHAYYSSIYKLITGIRYVYDSDGNCYIDIQYGKLNSNSSYRAIIYGRLDVIQPFELFERNWQLCNAKQSSDNVIPICNLEVTYSNDDIKNNSAIMLCSLEL